MNKKHNIKINAMVMSVLFGSVGQSSWVYAETLINESGTVSPMYKQSSTSDYWTAERLKDAQAEPMSVEPEFDAEQPSYLEKNFMETFDAFNDEPAAESQSQAGYAVSEDSEPDYQNQLFEVEEIVATEADQGESDTSISVHAAGTSSALYSSAGLIPGSARTHYPYRTVGKLFFTATDGRDGSCSASVISPRVILTAGHCLHNGNGDRSGWYSNFLFIPAFENGNAPFSQWDWSYAWTSPDWFSGRGVVPNAGDVGLLVINDQTLPGTDQPTRIGDRVGWLGWKSHALSRNHVHMLGYPSNFNRGLKMHQVASQAHNAKGSVVEYGSDMSKGSSGGPWVENLGSGNHVVGVTSYGYDDRAVKLQGSSVLNEAFIKGFDHVCAREERHCQ